MPPKTIAVLSVLYPPVAGGAERQIEAIAHHLAEVGNNVEAVVGLPPTQHRNGGIAGYSELRIGKESEPEARRIGSSYAARTVAHLLRTRPNLTIASMLGAASVAGSAYSRLTRSPLIVRLAGGQGINRTETDIMASTRQGRAALRLLRSPRVFVVAPAQHLLDNFLSYFPEFADRSQLIPNGVTDVHFDAGAVAFADRPRSVLWYTNGAQVKNSRLFLEVVSAMPRVDFTAIGAVADLPAADNLRRLGWVSDVSTLWSQTRVVLNTSDYEGHPNLTLQGLAGGCRAVGVDNAGMRELREQLPESIDLAAMGDVAALTATLAAALDKDRPPVPAHMIRASESLAHWSTLADRLG